MSSGRAPPQQYRKGDSKTRYFVYIILALTSALAAVLLPTFTDVTIEQALYGVFLVLVAILLIEVMTMPRVLAPGAAPAGRGKGAPPGKGGGKRPAGTKKPVAKPKTSAPAKQKAPSKKKSAGPKPAPRKKPAKVIVEEESKRQKKDGKKPSPPAPDKPTRPSTMEIKKDIESRRILSYPAVVSGGKYGDCFIVIDRNTVLKMRTLLARSCRMCKNRDSCWEKYRDVMEYETFMSNVECLEEEMDIIAEEEAVVEQIVLEDETEIVIEDDYSADETHVEEYEEGEEESVEEESYEEGEEEIYDEGDSGDFEEDSEGWGEEEEEEAWE